jgi:exopolysaccharide biosynthesis polyprenyl glycosylphosphotransferase
VGIGSSVRDSDEIAIQRRRDSKLGTVVPDADGAAALVLPEFLRLRSETSVGHGRAWLIHRLLLVADVAGLSLAFLLSQYFFAPISSTRDVVSPSLEMLAFLLTVPLWVVMAQVAGLYGRGAQRADHSTVDDFVGVFAVITAGAWLFSAFVSLTHTVTPAALRMVAFWIMAISFVIIARAIARAAARRLPMFWQNTVIVGAGDVGQLIARKLEQHPEYAIRLVGFVDIQPREPRSDLSDLRLLGPPDRLPELVERFDIDRVIIAYSVDSHEELLELIHKLKAASVQIDLVPRLFEAVGPRVDMHTVEALPLIGLPPACPSPTARLIKRSLDVVLASSALIVVSPLFAYIAWRVRRDSPGPVFFRQTRLGLNMNEFTALKFRTMRLGVDNEKHREYIKATMSSRAAVGGNGLYKLDRPADITPCGRWLRKTSLDELPQLINVVRGDMSLVGPRPCIPYEAENFEPHHYERFLVPPGITGLWQVAARARSSFGEALDMDVAYARSWSLGLDLRLLCRTPFAVLRQTASTT